MLRFIRRWSWEIALAIAATLALGMGLSLSENQHLAYAPCLAKVMTALRNDPAAARWTKISSEPMQPQPADCAIADDVARDANRVIGDLLISDPALFNRLTRLFTDAGMQCHEDEHSVICDCKSRGPFAIANPCEDCAPLVNLPIPFRRALYVAVSKRTALRKGKKVNLGRYLVEVSYRTALIETDRPPPHLTTALGSYEIIDRAYDW